MRRELTVRILFCSRRTAFLSRRDHLLIPSSLFYSYKAIGHDNVNELGDVDTNEQFNLSHDDLLSYPKITHNDYPEPVKRNIEKCRDFTSAAHAVTMFVLSYISSLPRCSVDASARPSSSSLLFLR